MIECYKTTVIDADPTGARPQRLVTQRIDKPEPGCWVSVVVPDANDRRRMQDEIGIEPAEFHVFR